MGWVLGAVWQTHSDKGTAARRKGYMRSARARKKLPESDNAWLWRAQCVRTQCCAWAVEAGAAIRGIAASQQSCCLAVYVCHGIHGCSLLL